MGKIIIENLKRETELQIDPMQYAEEYKAYLLHHLREAQVRLSALKNNHAGDSLKRQEERLNNIRTAKEAFAKGDVGTIFDLSTHIPHLLYCIHIEAAKRHYEEVQRYAHIPKAAKVICSVEKAMQWTGTNDIGIITACRSQLVFQTEKTLMDKEPKEYYSPTDNEKRNYLLERIIEKEFGFNCIVIPVLGYYTENPETQYEKRVEDPSYFVVNVDGTSQEFYENMFDLSELFNQDSFFYKPKDKEECYLVGTNLCNSPGYKKWEEVGTIHIDAGQSKFGTEFSDGTLIAYKEDVA